MKILLDIDGTLADNSLREQAARKPDGKLDWLIFTDPERVLNDGLMDWGGPPWPAILLALNRWVEDLVQEVYYLSGREEQFRAVTRNWLAKHDFPLGPLLLRPDGDRRGDAAFKGEVLNGLKEVLVAVDDCGQGYQDPAALRLVYEVRDIPLLLPQEAFGPPDRLRSIIWRHASQVPQEVEEEKHCGYPANTREYHGN